jgi:aminopeptidase N
MEHATNIAFMQSYLNIFSRDCETTMAHELSHHWFGNLVTCDSAPEMWLNESWATYSQSLFIEGLYGVDSATQYRSENHANELQMAHVNDGGYLPVSGVPSRRTYGSTVYEKGGAVIQTLRYYVGDSIFFSCVKSYLNHFAFGNAGTTQLRDYLNQCSGKNLNSFFDNWVLAPGYTHFSISDEYVTHTNGKYHVSVNILQRLSHAPKFYEEVPVTISYFDHNMRRHDEKVYVSGECSIYSTQLDFKPELIALDFDENLMQAISDNWRVVDDTGVYDFNNAMVSVKVASLRDSSLIRVQHNWLAPEGLAPTNKSLHLHPSRYWTVDGIFDPAMKALGIFEFNSNGGEHLDAGFITNPDNLVMMYRPNQQTDWKKIHSFVEKSPADTDKAGAVIVYPLKKGEYAFAIYNAQMEDEAKVEDNCGTISKSIKAGEDFSLAPDKSNGTLIVTFAKNIFEQMEIRDADGRKIIEHKIDVAENKLSEKFSYTANASYIVTLSTKTGKRISKKLINP